MKNYDFAKKKVMTPGPVPLPDYVRDSLRDYECHHRTKEFTAILESVFENLKKVFQTKQHCFLMSSTGSGGLEAALVNTTNSKSKVLTINAGKFGERWAKIAKAYKIDHTELQMEWGKDIDLDQVRDELKKGGYTNLAFQGCETSTGSLLQVKELCEIAKENNALSMVDGITALGAVDLPMDELGIDVFIGGSQKAFMLPTGMSFISLSEKAEAIESDHPKFYFDLAAEKKVNLSGKTRWSTATHFVIALDLVLDHILNQTGLKNHFVEIEKKAQFFRELVNLEMFPETASPSLTCMKMPEGVSGNDVKAKVLEDGFIIMGGQEKLADKVLRVGHMGAMTNEELKQTAEAINRHL